MALGAAALLSGFSLWGQQSRRGDTWHDRNASLYDEEGYLKGPGEPDVETDPWRGSSNRPLRFISDPGHGWLEVPMSDLVALGIASEITNYSFMKGDLAYLEEDWDVTQYIKALEAQGKSIPEIKEVYQASTPIRKYASYRAPK